MRPTRPWLWIWALFAAACGGEGDDDEVDPCGLEEALPGTALDELGKLASVTLQERAVDGGQIERFATGAFLDFTEYDADDAPTNNFDLVCSSIVGVEVVRVDKVPLEAPDATLSIGGSDPLAFEEVGEGVIRASDIEEVDAGDVATLAVEGGEEATEFPSFSLEVEVPSAPEDLSTERTPAGALVVRWRPSSADALEIEMRDPSAAPPEPPQPESRVRCVVRDDGCLTMSTTAVSWLSLSMDPVPLEFRVAAARSAEWRGPDGEIGFFKVERRRDVSYTP